MENLKQSFVYKRVRKTYRKARKTVLDKGKSIEKNLIVYLESEVAPSISVAKFSSTDVEHQYYAKIASLKNIYAMLVELEKNNPFLGDQDKSHKFIAIGKVVANKYSDTELRYLLALLALNTYEDTLTFSGLFWACIHTERYQDAAKVLSSLSLSQNVSPKQIESFNRALLSRFSKADIERYMEGFKQNNNNHIKSAKLKEKLSEQENEYLKLINQQDFKALANGVFTKFNSISSIDEVLDFINLEFKAILRLPTKTMLLILINVGKKFAEHGHRAIEIALIEEALSIKKYPLTVKSAFWAYCKQGDINKSREMLEWLENHAQGNKNSKLMEFVESKKKSYLFLTNNDFLQLIEDAKENRIEEYKPNAKTIAYVLHNSLPYASGGYATRGHGLATALAKNGYNVNIITRPGFPLDTKKELQPSDVINLQNIDGVAYHTILEPRRDQLATFEYIQQAAAKLIEKFEIVKPSLVVGASNHLTALPALIAARKLGIPFIYEVRGFWEVTRVSREPEFENTEWYKLLCSFEALTASQADHAFTLTTPMAEELERRGVNKDTITILPNSCNPERFEPTSRNMELADSLSIPTTVPVIGYIGTFVQYEGLEHIAEACGILKQKGLEFRLLVVGNENTAGNDKGPITQKILDVATDYGFSDWLIMPGRIPHDEVEAYYSLIDIAPFPRKPQPVTEMVSPMKPLEAAAMKKAIVVSSVRALTDMVTDGENGLVFEKGNIEDFAEKLFKLVNDDDLRIQLGAQARKWVEMERTWESTSNIFCEIAKKLEPESETKEKIR